MRFVLSVLLWTFCVTGGDLYQIHQPSEQTLLETYTRLLRDACRHAEQDWKSSSFAPAAGYWGNGISGGNEGIRAVGGMGLACGALLKYDEGLTEAAPRALLGQATPAVPYTPAHPAPP